MVSPCGKSIMLADCIFCVVCFLWHLQQFQQSNYALESIGVFAEKQDIFSNDDAGFGGTDLADIYGRPIVQNVVVNTGRTVDSHLPFVIGDSCGLDKKNMVAHKA